ncbi:DUF2975 domain-containing protein [Shewanella sp. SP2S2-6]
MNQNFEKLIKISEFCRWLVLFSAVAIVGYLIYCYWAYDDIRFNSRNTQLLELWHLASANRMLLLAILTPLFITFLLGVYWLQRLLSCYQRGLFFSDESMKCYLWLVWLKVAALVFEMLQTLGIGYYHQSFFEDGRIELVLDFGNITTILLMLLIVYLLKAARDYEAENQEFV